MSFRQVRRKFEELGVLLLSDKSLPSVVGMAGGPDLKGSWWGHEKGHEIFRQLGLLESDPDVLTTRLVSGKVTYLHRRFWPDFISVAVSREKWQTRGLDGASRRLLGLIDKDGEARLDRIARPASYGKAAKEIERRLLVYTEEIHTEKGSHSKMLMTWSRCPKIRDQHLALKDASSAKSSLESLIDGLNERCSGRGSLPWRQ